MALRRRLADTGSAQPRPATLRAARYVRIAAGNGKPMRTLSTDSPRSSRPGQAAILRRHR
jgi:hypothetical protein